MEDEKVRRLQGGRELWQGDKMNGLGEPLDHSEDGGVTLRRREASDKIHSYVGPGMVRDGEGWGEGLVGLLEHDKRPCCGHRLGRRRQTPECRD